MPVERAEAIALMRPALKAKKSFGRFYTELIGTGLRYRRSDMLRDWASVQQAQEKDGKLKWLAKGRYPPETSVAAVGWEQMSETYMYKVRTLSRLKPDEPITERFVNVMHDKPLTITEIERYAWEMISEQSPKEIAKVVEMTAWTVYKKVV